MKVWKQPINDMERGSMMRVAAREAHLTASDFGVLTNSEVRQA